MCFRRPLFTLCNYHRPVVRPTGSTDYRSIGSIRTKLHQTSWHQFSTFHSYRGRKAEPSPFSSLIHPVQEMLLSCRKTRDCVHELLHTPLREHSVTPNHVFRHEHLSSLLPVLCSLFQPCSRAGSLSPILERTITVSWTEIADFPNRQRLFGSHW